MNLTIRHRGVFLVFVMAVVGTLLVHLCAKGEPLQNMQKQALPTSHSQEGLVETLSGQIVKLASVDQRGHVLAGVFDFYLRASIQDYFIKFCESRVTPSQLQGYVDQGITLEVIKKNGNWDSCDQDDPTSSRTGLYIRVVGIK